MTTQPSRGRMLVIALLGLAALGALDASYLTWDHYAHLASEDYAGGLCGVGGGCDVARTSPLSELPLPAGLPGIPIALLGVAFYAAFALLVRLASPLFRGGDERGEPSRARAALGAMAVLAVLSVAYSLFLAAMSLRAGGLCPFCTGLYVVNLGLLALTFGPARRAAGGFGGPSGALRSLTSRPALFAQLLFVLVLGAGYGAYALALSSARDSAPPAPLLKGPARDVPTEGRPTLGPASAKLHVVEFADFECPHCGVAFRKLSELSQTFPEQLRVTFLHFPLDEACNPLVTRPFHARACSLATLAECAHAQGRFVEAAGLIYSSQRERSDAELRGDLVALGLDKAALEACLADPKAAARVRADIDAGLAAEVQGTPTLLVNGRELGRPMTEAVVRELLGP
jgi:protein-disulfide isomerase/uncharacterized membrane protein